MSSRLPRRRQSVTLCGILCAPVLLLAACASGGAATGASAPAGSGAGPASVTLVADPSPMRANQEATLRIRVADADGKGVPGGSVSVSAKHLSMAHGGVDANATEAGSGDYTAKIRPTMAGTWRVTVTAQTDGATRKADFDLPVQ